MPNEVADQIIDLIKSRVCCTYAMREGGTCSFTALRMALLPLLASVYREGAEDMRERAAKVIEEGQETHTSTGLIDRRHITPRRGQNLSGLAYADAIRALRVSDGSPEGGKTQSGLIEDDSAAAIAGTPVPLPPLPPQEGGNV